MKKLLLISAIALAASSLNLQADNTDDATMTATGDIIAALAITQTTGLTVPDLVLDDAAATSVTVNCTNTSTTPSSIEYGGQGNPFAAGVKAATDASAGTNKNVAAFESTGACAQLAVAGESAYAFAVATALPAAALATGVTVTAINCNTTTQVLNAGAANIFCGATVEAGTTADGTDYAAADAGTITVTYD